MGIVKESGYSLHNFNGFLLPVLLAVPHAGRIYPAEIYDNLRLPAASLLRLEDRYADLLAREAIKAGVPTLVAHNARAWIDLNRDERDVDAEMIAGLEPDRLTTPGVKQRGGLGLIPRRLYGEGNIWKRRIAVLDLNHRIESFHRPYHQHVSETLTAMQAQFGVAILLDLHSMPPIISTDANMPAQFVIGDRYGRSATGLYSEMLLSRLKTRGFVTALNHPYSGDHMLHFHGKPSRNIHAIQLEIDRSLYLDAALREPGEGVDMVSLLVLELIELLVNASDTSMMIAAE